MRYHDSRLVHDVLYGPRSFSAWNGSVHEWGSHEVWATACGKILAVGEARFSWTKKHPTCLECIVGNQASDPWRWTSKQWE